MSYSDAIQVLKAAADPTRFRLLSLLRTGEATVGELQSVLQQSQPRVSRHLRLLGEAGLVDQFRDGQWKYYRLDGTPSRAAQIARLLDLAGDDPAIERDRGKLNRLKREREQEALRPATSASWIGRRLSEHRPGDAAVADTLNELLGEARFDDALLIGCGSGALLSRIAPFAERVVAIDDSKNARLIARSRVHQSNFSHLTVRNADPAGMPYDDASFQFVALNEALGASDASHAVLTEAVRVMSRDGRLVIFDRVQPAVTRLSSQAANGLAENQLSVWLSELGCRITQRRWFAGRVMEYAMFIAVKIQTG